MKEYLDIHPAVRDSLEGGKPVVALESTIISHGMPYPQNYETALKLEEIVRENGATPATIAIMSGRLKVGLTNKEIHLLSTEGTKVQKASRRDLPLLILSGQLGATTVAATMIAAQAAGIRIFATGGIGGVHRDVHKTWDISADLPELSRTNVAVVCSGIKSILDLGLSLEYLETHGVPVIGYRTSELPAFYTSKSGLSLDFRLDTALDIAQLLKVKWAMGLDGGVVIANPIPAQFEMDKHSIDRMTDQALAVCNELNITGKAVTPFLLAKIEELTGGSSLRSNIQLVYNNARLAAEIAVALSN